MGSTLVPVFKLLQCLSWDFLLNARNAKCQPHTSASCWTLPHMSIVLIASCWFRLHDNELVAGTCWRHPPVLCTRRQLHNEAAKRPGSNTKPHANHSGGFWDTHTHTNTHTQTLSASSSASEGCAMVLFTQLLLCLMGWLLCCEIFLQSLRESVPSGGISGKQGLMRLHHRFGPLEN